MGLYASDLFGTVKGLFNVGKKVASVGASAGGSLISSVREKMSSSNAPRTNQPQVSNTERPDGIAVGIGVSTGELLRRGHAQGLVANQYVWLANDAICQNVIVLGKTYSAPSLQ